MKFNKTLRLGLGQAGFTLIELIIVIAIIALLAAATFVAVNPAKRIGDANNAQRWSAVTAVADAYSLYLADNSGTAPTTTPAPANGTTYAITSSTPPGTAVLTACAGATGNVTTTTKFINLANLVTSGYIGTIASDPSYVVGDAYQTGYYFYKNSAGVIKVGSCETYNTENIEVVR